MQRVLAASDPQFMPIRLAGLQSVPAQPLGAFSAKIGNLAPCLQQICDHATRLGRVDAEAWESMEDFHETRHSARGDRVRFDELPPLA